MVSLTLMLVIATIVSSIQMTLPVTPYLKMIDVWLFAATNMMGYLLIFHTYIEFKLKYSSNKHSGLLFTRRNSKWGNVTESSTRYKKILCKVVLIKEAQFKDLSYKEGDGRDGGFCCYMSHCSFLVLGWLLSSSVSISVSLCLCVQKFKKMDTD